MFFKHEYILKQVDTLEEGYEFKYQDEASITVTIKRIAKEDLKSSEKSGDSRCETTVEIEPGSKIREDFTLLSKKIVPPGVKIDDNFDYKTGSTLVQRPANGFVDEAGAINSIGGLRIEFFPKYFTDFYDHVGDLIEHYSLRTVRVLRWFQGTDSAPDPIRHSKRTRWSLDGEHWESMPSDITGTMLFGPPHAIIKKEILDSVQEMVKKGVDEPIGHNIWRDAWAQKDQSPRSALILGIAAAETGFKQLVAKLVPDAEWLVLEVPSPPLVKMLKNYLPALPLRHLVRGKKLPPPRTIQNSITEANELRNKLIHRGEFELTSEKLHSILINIRDLLYLFDYYGGEQWAADHMSVETAKDLIQMAKSQGAK